MTTGIKKWFESGSPWVWLTAAAVSTSVIMVAGLLLLISVNGLNHFWPKPIMEVDYLKAPGEVIRVFGMVRESEEVPRSRIEESGLFVDSEEERVTRHLLKIGNRDAQGFDFGWFLDSNIRDRRYPENLMALERREWGDLIGYLKNVKQQDRIVATGEAAVPELEKRLKRALELFAQIREIEKDDIGSVNYALERLRLQERKLELKDALTPARKDVIARDRAAQDKRYEKLRVRLSELYEQINRDSLTAEIMDGRELEVPLAKAVRVYWPNALSWPQRVGFFLEKTWEFVADEPREANTEGGIFPAIFGTVMMVIVMSIFVTPAGVIAAVYLREYAKQGPITRLVRIAVNNLAGVPSIVYGVFGLGFFVYFLGGNLDQLFFPEALPAPTFGTPGIFWAALTLALLTMPVVIVATEEGLARIPSSIREGSLALGATKVETLWRTVLPMASPAMMTGLILAIARAAGEVAPLMLVGVVKLAPSLPLDGNAPFIHLERKFMHLGFHIYDVGFQSPNVEAARPLVYATSLLLVLVIVVLNLAAIGIRNHLREKYRALEGG